MLVLIPQNPLTPGTHIVRVVEGGFGGPVDGTLPTDLTGQELARDPGEQLFLDFFVTASAPEEPSLLMTFPQEGDAAASNTTELLTVFDRALDEATVSDASFVVEADGAAPAFDPVATVVNVGGVDDTRFFRWQSTDAGVPVALPTNASMRLTLSPVLARIEDLEGDALATTTVDFDVAEFGPPMALELRSQPTFGIGVRNLTEDGDEDLELQVDLVDAQEGDICELFLFGTDSNPLNDQLIALRRVLELDESTPTVAIFDLETIDLTVEGDPAQPRFRDGPVSFGARILRGAVFTPLRVLDVDVATDGIQDPVLDTVPPTVLSLEFSDGTLGSVTSDLSDLTIAGFADTVLESLEITALDGTVALTNGTLPPLIGTRADGAFLATPFGSGRLTTGVATYTAVAYDEAFNASAPFTGTFHQVGAVGPGAFTPGDTISVDVFDALNLQPIAGARVLVHDDLGDGSAYPFRSTGLTDALGRVDASSGAGVAGAVLTVVADGYDLFSFHGVPSSAISVPLTPSNPLTASVSGTLTSTDDLAELTLPGLDRRLDDSRRPRGLVRGYATGSCSVVPFSCSYGPEAIRPDRLGVQAFLAGNFQATELSFDPEVLLQAFCLETPLARTSGGEVNDTSFALPFLITDPSVVAEERPQELDPLVLNGFTTSGLDTANLDDDPATTGGPRISVEALVPGVPGSVQVGLGLAFPQGGEVWNVRSVRPGAVSPLGFFGLNGTVDPDLFVRCELRDVAGNRGGCRPRLSDIPGLDSGQVFVPPMPLLTGPAPGGSSGGRSYDLTFQDALPDPIGAEGLYRAELADESGRRWVLWRRDPSGTGTVRIHVANLADASATGLADGTITCELGATTWDDLDPTSFFWSDVERLQDVFSSAAPVTFTQVP